MARVPVPLVTVLVYRPAADLREGDWIHDQTTRAMRCVRRVTREAAGHRVHVIFRDHGFDAYYLPSELIEREEMT